MKDHQTIIEIYRFLGIFFGVAGFLFMSLFWVNMVKIKRTVEVMDLLLLMCIIMIAIGIGILWVVWLIIGLLIWIYLILDKKFDLTEKLENLLGIEIIKL